MGYYLYLLILSIYAPNPNTVNVRAKHLISQKLHIIKNHLSKRNYTLPKKNYTLSNRYLKND